MRHWKLIIAVVAILGEVALQVSGYTSLPLAIALGVVIVVLLFWSAWPSMKRIRFQRPIKMQGHTPKSKDQEAVKPPTEQEIAENLAFLQALRAVADKLHSITQGSYSNSIITLFQEITNQESMRTYLRNDNLISQAARLLVLDLKSHQDKARAFAGSTETLDSGILSQNDGVNSCRQAQELVFDYQRLVKEVATFLDGVRSRGLEPFWTTNPWIERIHRYLTDDYDRFMALISSLRIHTPRGYPKLLPDDSQLGTLSGQALFP